MEVILKVLEGAKTGAKIAVKKNEFLIGRSQECHLCAGSTAISRRHCVIRRHDGRISVQDLGSRNGTLVNGVKTAGEVNLQSGDELVIGPLKFLVTISLGIKNSKAPQVKSVAEAAERAAASTSDSTHEDDISQWLLGPGTGGSAFSETQTIRMDDTNTIQLHADEAEKLASAATDDAEDAADDAADSEPPTDQVPPGNKGTTKGKLPTLSATPAAKDSGEAAAQALRNWSRRR